MSIFTKLLIALLALPFIAFAVLLIALDNPDAYKTMLTESFHDETDLNLKIEGDIKWRYWPPVAIDISGISITPDQSETPLATLQSANIDIQVIPLLTGGKILIDEIHINGIEINALVDKNGKENWVIETPEATAASAQNQENSTLPSDTSGTEMSLNISEFSINNATIRYQDQRDDSQYLMQINTFTSDALLADQPANISLDMRLEDQKANIINDVEVAGVVSFNKTQDQFKFENLSILNKVNQPELPEILTTIKMSGVVDTKHDSAEIENGSFQLGSLHVTFSASATNLSGTPKLKGKISAPSFDPRTLLASLDITLPAMQNPATLNEISFSGDFGGTSDTIKLDNLIAKIDNNTLEGTSTLSTSPVQALKFDLRLDHINISDYMEPDPTEGNELESSPAAKASSQIADSEIIPVAMLETTKIDGVLAISELAYDDYKFNGIQLSVINQNAGFRFNAKASGYGGEFAMQTHIREIDNEREPRGKLTLVFKDINMAALSEIDSLTGTLALDSSTQFSGNMLSEILSSMNGQSNFTVADGTLNVKPIKSLAMVIEGIQGKGSSISTWPDLLPFKRLEGEHQINDGIKEDQQFSFAMENMEVKGKGGIDYFANSLDFNIETTLKENVGGQFTVNKNLAGIKWPLHCTGSLDATATELCLADKSAITKLVTALAKQAVRKKGEDKLLETVPDEYKDTAKKLLKGLFN